MTTLEVDFQGYPNWRERMFGDIVLIDNQPIWHKSILVEQLESLVAAGERDITVEVVVKNLNPAECGRLKHLLAQGSAQGYLEYFGYRIELFGTIKLALMNDIDFDFRIFPEELISVYANVTDDLVPADATLINTQLFDLLLQRHEITAGVYREIPGLIKASAARDPAELALFITSALSESQWYCLCYEASQYGIQLALYLAPGVVLPETLIFMPDILEKYVIEPTAPPWYLTNDADLLIESAGIGEKSNTLILASEDYNFEDLFFKTDYELVDGLFRNFVIFESELIQALFRGQHVILKGEFSPEFLQLIQPIVARQGVNINGEFKAFVGNLIVVVEKPELTPDASVNDSAFEAFAWLGRDRLQVEMFVVRPQEDDLWIMYQEEEPARELHLETAAADAKKFIDKRKQALFAELDTSPWVQLVGETGVGKSSLMREIESVHADEYTVYRELGAFDAWARDCSCCTKILFIDESNIENRHFMFLSPLEEGKGARVLYQGKIYDLSPQHKVVFARNPHDYGAGRVQQKLFMKHVVPALVFKDFPPAYIYHQILSPIYKYFVDYYERNGSPLDEATKRSIEDFCRQEIHNYMNASIHITVRQLQEKLLSRLVSLVVAEEAFKVDDERAYVLTPSAQPIRARVMNFIHKKKLEEQGALPFDAGLGLNGILLEGESGCGKSALVHMVLEQYYHGRYIKIDASMAPERQRQLLIEAFHSGKAVWLDEINAISNDLEKVLNSLLTGLDPDTGTPMRRPGFAVFATANGVDLPGRQLISPALRARFVNLKMKTPTLNDLRQILEVRGVEDDIEACMAGISQLIQRHPHITLRDILNHLDEPIAPRARATADRC